MTSQENSRMHRIAELISALGPYGEPVIEALLLEYFRAQKKHPDWPQDAVHASAILSEEAGELTQAALDFHYGALEGKGLKWREMLDPMRLEAVQSGAMSVRFLLHLPEYQPKSGMTVYETPDCGPVPAFNLSNQ